ncbi:MAG: hypothetical protein JSW71_19005 [Gemmatimonadota bacterium]|nr:MAG: hypothetical protein JSW71_19005 [Gemmatimonadota bacterium]
MIHVGRVTAVFWPGDEAAVMALAELADRTTEWPGISDSLGRPIRLFLAPSDAKFDSLTRGLLPEWGGGAAFPGSSTIVLKLTGDVRRVMRHELAHLALRSVVRRVPLWFDEGYAALAAGEWDRLEALRVNWALLMGATPTLRQVVADLRDSGSGRAETAYALATTAALLLERMGGERGLGPLVTNLGETADFDRALRTTYQMTLDQFEAHWRRDLKRRYGWALFFGSLTVVWTLLAMVLVSLWLVRRRRDRARRARLDEGWVIPPDDWHASA